MSGITREFLGLLDLQCAIYTEETAPSLEAQARYYVAKRDLFRRAAESTPDTDEARDAVEAYGEADAQLLRIKARMRIRDEDPPQDDRVRQALTQLGASEGTEEELRSMLEAARIEYATHRDIARRGGGLEAQQATYAEQERAASRIVEYRPAMVPGLAQTPSYGREMMKLSFTARDDEEIERVVGARMERQQVLYEPGHRLQMVLGEAALRSTPGTLNTLLGQLDRLASLAELEQVDLGILPFPVMPIMPLAGFSLRDRVASVETITGEQALHEPTEVATYEQAFEVAWNAAETGQDAVTLIQRIAQELR